MVSGIIAIAWLWLLYELIVNWQVTLTLVAVGIAVGIPVYFLIKRDRDEAAELAREAWREAAQTNRAAAEAARFVEVGKSSLRLFEDSRHCLKMADISLNLADRRFRDRAFAPFWDEIEDAARYLARFKESNGQLSETMSEYQHMVRQYKAVAPPFPIQPQSYGDLVLAETTAERLGPIVSSAQRDFQFAMIYEQRKTNQIVVAGFTNLGSALDDMTYRIVFSIDELRRSADRMG